MNYRLGTLQPNQNPHRGYKASPSTSTITFPYSSFSHINCPPNAIYYSDQPESLQLLIKFQ